MKSWFLEPSAAGDAPRPVAPTRELTSAAVLGRPGEAEPVAAALALTLARHARTRAATVALLAAPPGPPPAVPTPSGGWVAPAEARPSPSAAPESTLPPVAPTVRDTAASPPRGGSRAARRLAARLHAHGLTARPRGRLVWVSLAAEGAAAAARRAVVAGAPAVLAVTAPRTAELEPVLAEQDLLVLVASDPLGPLARLAALTAGEPPLVIARPLRRGPARSLACAGLAAPREIVALLASDGQAA